MTRRLLGTAGASGFDHALSILSLFHRLQILLFMGLFTGIYTLWLVFRMLYLDFNRPQAVPPSEAVLVGLESKRAEMQVTLVGAL